MIYPIGVYRPISRPKERDPNIQTHENANFRAAYSKKCVPVYLYTEAPKQQDTLNKIVFTCGRAYKLFVSWKQIDIEIQDRYSYIYPYIDTYEPGGLGTRSKGSGIPIVRFLQKCKPE